MNTPPIRILLLSLALLGVQTPLPMQARGTALAAKQEEAKKRAAQNEAARRAAAARSRQAPKSRPASPNRNPLTGSRPKPAANRPNPKPASKPKAAAPPANRPGPKGPSNTANRPAPKAPATPVNRAAPKAPANTANRPAPKVPANNPANRPNPRPPAPAAKRPAPKPQVVANRTGQRAAVANRAARPAFVPGKVTYPGKVTRPNPRPAAKQPARPANRASKPRTLNQVIASNSNIHSNNRVTNVTSVNNTTNNRVTNIGNTTTRNRVTNVSHNTYVNNNWGNQWTNNRTSVWNRNRAVNNRPVVINQNFQRSQNYAYRPASWGGRPWWSSPTYHNWHHGSWNYGWNRQWNRYHTRPSYRPPAYYPPGYYQHHHHNHSSAGSTVAWGLAAWTLGSLAFDTGYNSYRNPYPAPPVQTRTTVINYTQPLSVVAAKEVPEPEETALTSEEKSTAAIERARAEFRNGDYLAALKSTDESISYAPGDSTLHEFRALCLFALGRYGDAAGVLNPVLASGPGWDWATMASFYPESETYTGQIRKLEAYVESKPDSADAHFLLGYHYMVAGFIDEAYGMFDTVTRLQPADTVAAQLRNLAESSSPSADGEDDEAPEAESLTGTPEPADGIVVEPIDPSDIEGSWKAASADGKAIVLALDPAGTFTWNYEGASDGKVLAGDWSIDDEGHLVLAADDVQMVADISLDEDTLQFVLAGSPVGDPGLGFERQ